jgi:hypothetical protein
MQQPQQQLLVMPGGKTDATAMPTTGLCGTLHHSFSMTTSSDSAGDAFPGINYAGQQQQFAGPCVKAVSCADFGIAPNSFGSVSRVVGLPDVSAVSTCGQVAAHTAYGSIAGAQQALDDWLNAEAERLVCEVMGAAAAVQQHQLHRQREQQQQQRLPLEVCQAIARSIMALEQQQQQHQYQSQQQSVPSHPWQQQQQALQPQACFGMQSGW